jgi:hypothetical protein
VLLVRDRFDDEVRAAAGGGGVCFVLLLAFLCVLVVGCVLLCVWLYLLRFWRAGSTRGNSYVQYLSKWRESFAVFLVGVPT